MKTYFIVSVLFFVLFCNTFHFSQSEIIQHEFTITSTVLEFHDESRIASVINGQYPGPTITANKSFFFLFLFIFFLFLFLIFIFRLIFNKTKNKNVKNKNKRKS